MLFSTVGITQFILYTNVRFYKYGHNSGQKCIPRHDSDGIRREMSRDKNLRYLPGPVDLQISWTKNNADEVDPQKVEKNNAEKVDPQKV